MVSWVRVGQEVGDSWVRDESLRRRGRWWKLPFIPNFSTSSFPTLRCVPTSVCLQTWLQPHSHQGRRLPGGEGSPKSVPVGFHLDIYPRPLLFRPGGEFIVGSRANIPPPASSSSSTRGRCWISSFQLRICLWNTEVGCEGVGVGQVPSGQSSLGRISMTRSRPCSGIEWV